MSENPTAVATTLGDGSKCEVLGPVASMKKKMGNEENNHMLDVSQSFTALTGAVLCNFTI